MMLQSCSSRLKQRSPRNWSAAPVYPVIDSMTGTLDARFSTPEIAT
jgi:hypothetical protein